MNKFTFSTLGSESFEKPIQVVGLIFSFIVDKEELETLAGALGHIGPFALSLFK